MATCTTDFWDANNSTPRVQLEVEITSQNDTSATLSYVFRYIASYAVSTSIKHAAKAVVNGSTVYDDGYAISGKKGTYTIKSGSTTVTKGSSSKTISFSCSMDFDGITWSGRYSGSLKSKSGSITISAQESSSGSGSGSSGPTTSYYTVKYSANGGSGAPSSVTKASGSAITISSTIPVKAGYTFLGWSQSMNATKPTYEYGDTYIVVANVTLFAVWSAKTYAIAYNANKGVGVPDTQIKKHGTAITLSRITPTRTNYAFIGWGTSAGATSASYQPGGSYSTNASITLYAVWSLSYTKPRITNITVERCDDNGVYSDTGNRVKVEFDWATDKPVDSIVVQWKSGNSDLTTYTFPVIEASGTGNTIYHVFDDYEFSIDSSYTFNIVVTDSSGSNMTSRTVSGEKLIIDALPQNKGIAFGKPAELDGYADFGYELILENNLRIASRDLQGNIKEAFQPQNSNGNTVIGWSNYDIGNGNTNVYGHDIYFGISNIATKRTYKPYFSRGDSVTLAIKTAGYVTNLGKDVTFTVPLTMPIVGNPTVTVTSNGGFVLRQDDKYTHGSNAGDEGSVHPDEYFSSLHMYGGVYITARFTTNQANVVNNAPIGIYWNGTITFS